MARQAGPEVRAPQILRPPSPGVLRFFGVLTALAGLALAYGMWRSYAKLERVETMLLLQLLGVAMQESNDSPAASPTWLAVSLATRYVGTAVEAAGVVYVFIAGIVAIRTEPRRAAWHLAAAGWVIVVCSLLTVLGIVVLVNWAQYPPVRPETVLKIGLAQSALGWILLVAMAGLRRG